MAEAVGLFLLRFAGSMQFDNFAFFDTGATLTQQFLIRHGYRPTVDFTYIYGLLTLFAGRVWFGIFGLTPWACIGLVPIADALIIWALLRLAAGLRLPRAGFLVIVFTAPFVVPSSFLHPTHLIEETLICHALAQQARSHRRSSLALVTGCAFIKPSMAYFYGLLLLGLLAAGAIRSQTPVRTLWRSMRPAVYTGAIILALLVANFGPLAVANSLFPRAAMGIYRAGHFGFFHGDGREFWAPSGASIVFYLSTIAGPWLVASVTVAAAGIIGGYRLMTNPRPSVTDAAFEIVLTCALLHLSFVILFFGNRFSWTYYFYLLPIGLASATGFAGRWRWLFVFVAVAVPVVKFDKYILDRFTATRAAVASSGAASVGAAETVLSSEGGFTYRLWLTTAPSAETAGLWAPPQEREEWMRVRSTIRGRRAVLLEWFGCADVLFPEFMPPVTDLLSPGAASKADLERKAAQIEAASILVLQSPQVSILDFWPTLGTIVRRDFLLDRKGKYFVVYVRRPDPA